MDEFYNLLVDQYQKCIELRVLHGLMDLSETKDVWMNEGRISMLEKLIQKMERDHG